MGNTTSHRERELKFEVPDGVEVPDISRGVAVGGVDVGGVDVGVQRRSVSLRSTYFDTCDLDLLGQKITLRRRTGDTDTGWQLKIPAGIARDELSVPLGDPDEPVPAELRELLTGVLGHERLIPVATLTTRRELTRLYRDDVHVLEVADDHVDARTPDGRDRHWREVEVELGPAGDEDDLAAVTSRFRRAGLTPSGSASKLARALGRDATDVPRCPAGRLLAAALTEPHRALITADIALRRRGDSTTPAVDAVALLAAVDRLHAAVRVFRPVLAVDAVLPAPGDAAALALQAELAWYRRRVRAVRDAVVVRDDDLRGEQTAALAGLVAAVSTNRYRRLLATLAALLAGDPVRPGTRRRDLRRLARRAERRALRRRPPRAGDVRRARHALLVVGQRPGPRLDHLDAALTAERDARPAAVPPLEGPTLTR